MINKKTQIGEIKKEAYTKSVFIFVVSLLLLCLFVGIQKAHSEDEEILIQNLKTYGQAVAAFNLCGYQLESTTKIIDPVIKKISKTKKVNFSQDTYSRLTKVYEQSILRTNNGLLYLNKEYKKNTKIQFCNNMILELEKITKNRKIALYEKLLNDIKKENTTN